jgi:excisionase family DNA binding protein
MRKHFDPIVGSPNGDILTDEQVANLLNITPRTLRLWRTTRGLPHIKLTSKVVRYRRADIDTWLQQHSVAFAV